MPTIQLYMDNASRVKTSLRFMSTACSKLNRLTSEKNTGCSGALHLGADKVFEKKKSESQVPQSTTLILWPQKKLNAIRSSFLSWFKTLAIFFIFIYSADVYFLIKTGGKTRGKKKEREDNSVPECCFCKVKVELLSNSSQTLLNWFPYNQPPQNHTR